MLGETSLLVKLIIIIGYYYLYVSILYIRGLDGVEYKEMKFKSNNSISIGIYVV